MGKVLGSLGSFCARHRWSVIAAWLILSVGAVVAVRALGAKTDNNLSLPGTGSQQAFDLLASKFPPQENGANPFVFHVDEGKLTDARYKPAMVATSKAIAAAPHVHSSVDPVSSTGQAAGFLSKDGKTGFNPVLLDINSGFVTVDLAEKILQATAPAREAGIQVAVGGSMGSTLSAPDTKTSEMIGNLSAMVILALVFGSLVAMGLPIVTAIFGLSFATSAIGLLGHVMGVPSIAPTIATMIGLGVGIDYALFLITKHKEGLAGGTDVHASISRAVATSGSAVVFAGGTVVIALLSLGVAGIPLVSALGIASAIAVLAAVTASVTLLPAMLSLLGHRVNALRVPAFLLMKPREPGHRRWDAWARWVTGHPWIAIGLSLLILLPLAVPLFSMRLGQLDVGVTPPDTTQRQAYDLLTQGFGVGYNGPLLIANELTPPAKASEEYTRKYDEAEALKRKLEREQRVLLKRKAELERRQAVLEDRGAALQRAGDRLAARGAAAARKAAGLQARGTELERQAAELQRQKASLVRQARTLLAKAKPLLLRLASLVARERLLQRLIQKATDPAVIARLEERLAAVQANIAAVRRQLQPIVRQARSLYRRAETLVAEARVLERRKQVLLAQKAKLEALGGRLRRQQAALEARAAELQRQAAQLKRQAAALQRRADRATEEKRRAEDLKRELTAMLTQAGGDPRGTDPRIVHLQDRLGDVSGVARVSPPQINDKGDAATLTVIPTTAPSAPATAQLVQTLRSTILPAATAGSGVTAYVGGITASNVDLAAKIANRMPLVVATILALSFLLLMVAFRSLLVPLQAALTNLLTVAAAMGVLTAVFQWGWGLSAIGLDAPNGTVPIASYVPLMMFAVLFGLSMDYEVFTVSRIQEHHLAGDDPRKAVTAGLGDAAHVVIAAALIMFCVFASFILNGDPTVKQFGVGLSVAVALAGSMVVLLAPAMLALFGRLVFAVPRWLGKILPRIDIE